MEAKCPVCGEVITFGTGVSISKWHDQNAGLVSMLAQHQATKHPDSPYHKYVSKSENWVVGLAIYFVLGILAINIVFYGRPTRDIAPILSDGPSSVYFFPGIVLYLVIGLLFSIVAWKRIAPIRAAWKEYLKAHGSGGNQPNESGFADSSATARVGPDNSNQA